MTKLYRPTIPTRVKLIVVLRQAGLCGCGCGEKLGTLDNTEFDHCPPLALREYDEATRTYTPDANDPEKIVARIKKQHRDKTNHPRGPHTTLGSDRHLIDKTRPAVLAKFTVVKPELPESLWCCSACGEHGTSDDPPHVCHAPRELIYSGRSGERRKTGRKIQSAGFDKTRTRRMNGKVEART